MCLYLTVNTRYLLFNVYTIGDLKVDKNDLTGTIALEICALRHQNLDAFVVDCPTADGRGVGTFTSVTTIDELVEAEENCFTTCRRNAEAGI
jgi:hypothetical protein